jgi:hypothetical protein
MAFFRKEIFVVGGCFSSDKICFSFKRAATCVANCTLVRAAMTLPPEYQNTSETADCETKDQEEMLEDQTQHSIHYNLSCGKYPHAPFASSGKPLKCYTLPQL